MGSETALNRSLNVTKTHLCLQVHLFVCNEDEDIKRAFELGATGVMSDYPSLLTSYLYRNRIPE